MFLSISIAQLRFPCKSAPVTVRSCDIVAKQQFGYFRSEDVQRAAFIGLGS